MVIFLISQIFLLDMGKIPTVNLREKGQALILTKLNMVLRFV